MVIQTKQLVYVQSPLAFSRDPAIFLREVFGLLEQYFRLDPLPGSWKWTIYSTRQGRIVRMGIVDEFTLRNMVPLRFIDHCSLEKPVGPQDVQEKEGCGIDNLMQELCGKRVVSCIHSDLKELGHHSNSYVNYGFGWYLQVVDIEES